MADFEDEISGYSNNHKIVDVLTGLQLKSGSANVSDNLYMCYESLVSHGFIDKQELPLLSAWIRDINSVLKQT